MRQQQRTLQQYRTTLAPDDVLKKAKEFFGRHVNIYATFLDMEGPGYCTFRGQGGEEIVIGVTSAEGGTTVSGSSYLFDAQVARFFSTLPPFELDETLLPATVAEVAQ